MSLRPVLPPGCDVVRRDASTLLVGTRPGVPVADRPGLVAVLRLLDGRTLASLVPHVAAHVPGFAGDVAGLLTELVATGVLDDAPAPPPSRLPVSVRPMRGARREAAAVAEALADVADPATPDPSLVVLVSSGEPDRRAVADLVSSGVPTLPVAVGTAWARLGPLTVLGRTSCLDCHDVRRSRWDPSWRVVVPQLGRPLVTAPRDRPSPAFLWRVAGEVAAEVEELAADRPVRTLGGVVDLGADGRADRDAVPVSVRCGCLLRRRA